MLNGSTCRLRRVYTRLRPRLDSTRRTVLPCLLAFYVFCELSRAEHICSHTKPSMAATAEPHAAVSASDSSGRLFMSEIYARVNSVDFDYTACTASCNARGLRAKTQPRPAPTLRMWPGLASRGSSSAARATAWLLRQVARVARLAVECRAEPGRAACCPPLVSRSLLLIRCGLRTH